MGVRGPPRAIQNYEKAVRAGFPEVIYSLGLCSHAGHGCPRDIAQAYDLIADAAGRGHVQA
jgi:TPR repeat protein